MVMNGKPGDPVRDWFDQAFGHRQKYLWSEYATDLYLTLRRMVQVFS